MLWCRPAAVLELAGLEPDPWQRQLLASTFHKRRTLLCCSRQVGKTQTAASLALRTAYLEAPALVLVLSPSERQSAEFVNRVKELHQAIKARRKIKGSRIETKYEKLLREAGSDGAFAALPEKVRESALQLHLDNGSRVIGLPASEPTIRGYSNVALLVIDEASRVPDNLYRASRAVLATSGGGLLGLTTPFGKRGWFFEEWEGDGNWQRLRISARQCPRIPKSFLEEERRSLGPRWYRQEYECSFEDVIDSVFAWADIQRALRGDLQPLFPDLAVEAVSESVEPLFGRGE